MVTKPFCSFCPPNFCQFSWTQEQDCVREDGVAGGRVWESSPQGQCRSACVLFTVHLECNLRLPVLPFLSS